MYEFRVHHSLSLDVFTRQAVRVWEARPCDPPLVASRLTCSLDKRCVCLHTLGMDADHTLPPDILAADWAATPLSVWSLVTALLVTVTTQQQQIAQLQVQVADLQARLNQRSQNSSRPPSSDSPSTPPRPSRMPRGRLKGGQAGHTGHYCPDPAPDQVDTTVARSYSALH